MNKMLSSSLLFSSLHLFFSLPFPSLLCSALLFTSLLFYSILFFSLHFSFLLSSPLHFFSLLFSSFHFTPFRFLLDSSILFPNLLLLSHSPKWASPLVAITSTKPFPTSKTVISKRKRNKERDK